MEMLSIFMVACSLLFLILIINLIRHYVFTLENSLLWLGIGFVMFVFSAFPCIPEYISKLLGFKTMSNFILVMAVLFCLIQLIFFTKKITKQSEDIKTLIHEVSVLKEKVERNGKKK